MLYSFIFLSLPLHVCTLIINFCLLFFVCCSLSVTLFFGYAHLVCQLFVTCIVVPHLFLVPSMFATHFFVPHSFVLYLFVHHFFVPHLLLLQLLVTYLSACYCFVCYSLVSMSVVCLLLTFNLSHLFVR